MFEIRQELKEIKQDFNTKFSTLESEIRKSKTNNVQPMRPVVI